MHDNRGVRQGFASPAPRLPASAPPPPAAPPHAACNISASLFGRALYAQPGPFPLLWKRILQA